MDRVWQPKQYSLEFAAEREQRTHDLFVWLMAGKNVSEMTYFVLGGT